jgi:hypothetical protein
LTTALPEFMFEDWSRAARGEPMEDGPPKLVALDHDDYHAEFVGRTADGRQFFLTQSFVPAMGGDPGREFLVLYLFDEAGALLDARVEDLGIREGLDEARAVQLRDEMLASLGDVEYGRIEVAPFRLERFGVEFGFIAEPPEHEDGEWTVIVEPGNFMAFYPPWDSGEYDT